MQSMSLGLALRFPARNCCDNPLRPRVGTGPGTHRPRDRKIQWTHRPRDRKYNERIVQGTEKYNGRTVRGTENTMNASSKGQKIQGTLRPRKAFGDPLAGESSSWHPFQDFCNLSRLSRHHALYRMYCTRTVLQKIAHSMKNE